MSAVTGFLRRSTLLQIFKKKRRISFLAVIFKESDDRERKFSKHIVRVKGFAVNINCNHVIIKARDDRRFVH